MTDAMVLEHIRKHQQDVEVKQIVQLEELQELRETIIDAVLERHPKTKHVRANLAQISALDKVVKMEWLVHSKDPSKMAMYSSGARVNPARGKQGPVNKGGKKVYSYWEGGGGGE
jgi:hypothetical protein